MKPDDALNDQWITAGGGDNTTYGSSLEGLAIDAEENSSITGECSGDTMTLGAYTFIGHTFHFDEVFTAKLDPIAKCSVTYIVRSGGHTQRIIIQH